MNRHLIISIVALLLVACSEKYNESVGLYPTLTPRYLAVTPTALTYTSGSETKSVTVNSFQTPWKFENGIEWVSLSPMSGSSSTPISIVVSKNTVGDEVRTGIFFLQADVNDWNYEMPISVTQSGAIPIITLAESEFEFTGAAGSKTVNVSSNCTWTVSSSSKWLSVARQDNAIVLTVASNETNSYRTATISVTHNGTINISKLITVRQAPASINASTETLVFNNTAGSVNVAIEAEASWTVDTSSSWIDVSPTAGDAGTSVITVSVAPNTSTNDRTGYVSISVGDKQRIQIPIQQRGIYIKAQQMEQVFDANGGSQELTVLSNTSWTISSVPSWITVSPSNGEGDCKIKVTAQDNPNTASRSGIIHITQSSLDIDVAISAYQKGKTFDVNTTVLNFGDKQETQTVSIETDGTWSAQTSDSWITMSPMSASGSSTLSVTVAENPDDNERTGQVVVTMGNKSATINVVQKGKYFTVSNSLLTYTSKGGIINISITTNDAWTARIEDNSDWIKLSETSGFGDVNVQVTATDNPSVNSRTATIIIETIHNQNVKVVVTQDARYLNVDTREILFYAKGGTSEAITISTDGDYKISCSDSWFTINESNNTFTVTATENPEASVRTGYITIDQTDLVEGSYSLTLSVTQLIRETSFQRDDFGDDTDYDSMGNTEGNLTITGFGSDRDYDSMPNGARLSVLGFKNNSDRDANTRSNVTITINGVKPITNQNNRYETR